MLLLSVSTDREDLISDYPMHLNRSLSMYKAPVRQEQPDLPQDPS